MTEQNMKENLPKFSNSKLCEIIVANRYLGIMRDEAIMCMEELARRRVAGDVFEYEKHIETVLDSLPKFSLDASKLFKTPRIF